MNDTVQSVSNIWRVGGVRSFWSGNGLNIVKMVPEGATKFGVYEVSRTTLELKCGSLR